MIEISKGNALKIINLTGHKLDGRKKYFVNDDCSNCEFSGSPIFILVKFSLCCSGCSDCGGYTSPRRGAGCEECGYQGRVRSAEYVPLCFWR